MTPADRHAALVEAVARGLWEEQKRHWLHYAEKHPRLFPPWEELGQSRQAELMREASAAIAACRPAIRAEALEEAASKADYWRKNYRLGETKRVRFDRRDMNSVISGTAQCIAEDIRAFIRTSS